MIISDNEMESFNLNHKSIERVVSQKAVQISSSFSCQICVWGFLCGVCITSLFMAALTSFGAFAFLGNPFSTGIGFGIDTLNSSSILANGNCNGSVMKERERLMYSDENIKLGNDERVSLIYSSWSDLVNDKSTEKEGQFLQKRKINIPEAPHLENCKFRVEVNERLDKRVENGSFPPWTIWKGMLDDLSLSSTDEQLKYHRERIISQGDYPPWITGSDVENYPLTRKVQRDIWLHQHPVNCSDPGVRFLVADWERLPGFGIGAQLAGMSGLLAIAINEKRVLVTEYYNRADHDGCKGLYWTDHSIVDHSSWDVIMHIYSWCKWFAV